jgi:hypothetical protein
MKLYLISQKINRGYDTYDSAVVAAPNANAAALIHPNTDHEKYLLAGLEDGADWVPVQYVDVKYLGIAEDDIQEGVICASFNAG